MAESRRQLINASSFFQREEGKFGGFRAKKSTISGESFKKGSSLGNVVGQESDVGKLSRILRDTRGKTLVNEKKITLLKKVSNLRKDNQQEKVNSPLLESLQAIAATTDSIRNTLIRQQDLDEDAAEKMRIAGEKADRDKQEKGLESEPGVLAKIGNKFVQPVMGLFEKIFNFIKTLLLGKFLMNFLDWFGNPENQGKIKSFVRFIKDWWPALTAAVLLFGTGFGGLVAGLVTMVAAFIPKLVAAIATMNPLLAGGLLAGGLMLGAKALDGDFSDKELTEEQKIQSKEKADKVMDMGTLSMNKGGQVPGSGNTDTVPAMLTPGEFVMSKGAVQKYGANALAGMNAAAGGTNRPTLMGGYKGGGGPGFANITNTETTSGSGGYGVSYVSPQEAKEKLAAQGMPSMELMDGTVVPNFGKMGVNSFNRGIQMVREGMANNPEKIKELDNFLDTNPYAQPDELQRVINSVVPGSQEQVYGDLGDSITASARMNGGGLVKGFQGGGLVLGFQGGGIVPRGKGMKYDIKPNPPKNTVVAYEQEVNKNQQQKTAPASGGNEIPSFDVAPIRDPLKMVTLQIVLF